MIETSSSPNLIKVFCGELCKSNNCSSTELNLLNRKLNDIEANITIKYDKFVNEPEKLPPRILDLLHIAAHVFSADRLINRGKRSSLSNSAWARDFDFHIPVLDLSFWNNNEIKKAISDALVFMTGDKNYNFSFGESKFGHLPKDKSNQMSLFNENFLNIDISQNTNIVLFSGGLDSLAGAIELLNTVPESKLVLVSHKTNPSVTSMQNNIVKYLQSNYPNRILHYGFDCYYRKTQSKEETQRTRMFLYSSIAFAICNCIGKHYFSIYENGITSINLPIQADVFNARASRTTHPKTINLMKKIFRFIDDKFEIHTPYYDKTKEDILTVFSAYNENNLIKSSISCSSTRKKPNSFKHCGSCSQCIDRRLAAYASNMHEHDDEYAVDFISSIPDDETKQRLIQMLRFASAANYKSSFELFKNFPEEITILIENWHLDKSEDSLEEIFSLLSKYSDSVIRAVKTIQLKYDNPLTPLTNNSFLSIISTREYLKTPIQLRIEELDKMLIKSIPQLFHSNAPKDENDFNNKLKALLTAADYHFTREYPVLLFGVTSYKADISDGDLIVESKYLRGTTSLSVITDGIGADIIKVNDEFPLFFIIYDPIHKIPDDDLLIKSFEQKRQFCYVRIYR